MSLVEAFFTKDASLESSNFIKKGLRHRGFPIWVHHGNSFSIIGKFSSRYLCETFSDKVAGFQSIGCNFIGNNMFDKNI